MGTSFSDALEKGRPMLGGGSMYERLRRHRDIVYDPHIAHAALIYDDRTRALVESVQREYIAVSRRAGLAMVVSASTWRAAPERVARSTFAGVPVNEDQIRFTRGLCDENSDGDAPLHVAAVMRRLAFVRWLCNFGFVLVDPIYPDGGTAELRAATQAHCHAAIRHALTIVGG